MFDPDLLHNYQHPTPVLHLSCTKHTLSWLYGCHSNWAHSVLLTLCVLTKSTHKILFYFIFFFWQSFTSFSVFTISRNSSSNPVLQGLAAFFFFLVCSRKWHSWLKGDECNCISATWLSLMLHVICTWCQSAMQASVSFCSCLSAFMHVHERGFGKGTQYLIIIARQLTTTNYPLVKSL